MEAARDLAAALDPAALAADAGMELDGWQRDALRSPASKLLLNCSRQAGKSTVSGIKALHTALYRPGALVLALAPSLRQSQELFSKIGTLYRDVGKPVPAEHEGKLSLELQNGSRIICLPGQEKTIRGFSGASLLLVDEAARIEDGLYHAVRPMLAVSGGTLWMLSTPYGKRGVFFETWESGDNWQRYEIPASEVSRISEDFLSEESRALPPRVFRQEYECSFEELEDQLFSHELVEGSITSEVKPLFGGSK